MIWPTESLSRCKHVMSAAFPANFTVLIPYVLVISSAIALSAIVTLLEISSGLGLLLAIGFLVATTGAFWVLNSGIRGQSWAISLYFMVVAFFIEATFRKRGLSDTGLDAQSLFKLLVWGGAFLIGAANFTHVKHALQRSNGLRWALLFAVWISISTVYSITPTFTPTTRLDAARKKPCPQHRRRPLVTTPLAT